jgi:hypothetical protein
VNGCGLKELGLGLSSKATQKLTNNGIGFRERELVLLSKDRRIKDLEQQVRA